MPDTHADALQIFGITGDLARQKIIPAVRPWCATGRSTCRSWASPDRDGISRSSWRTCARRSPTTRPGSTRPPSPSSPRSCATSTATTPTAIRSTACGSLGESRRPLHYLAIPPSLFETVAQHLARVGCAEHGSVVVEKPFGRDLASAHRLNEIISSVFAEERIFRIDHFLGKEPVQNLVYFRFANTFSSRSGTATTSTTSRSRWPRTSAFEGRGRFYDRPARSATSCRTTCCRSSRSSRWIHPPRPTTTSCRANVPVARERSGRSTPADVVQARCRGYLAEPRASPRAPPSETYVGRAHAGRELAVGGRAVLHPGGSRCRSRPPR